MAQSQASSKPERKAYVDVFDYVFMFYVVPLIDVFDYVFMFSVVPLIFHVNISAREENVKVDVFCSFFMFSLDIFVSACSLGGTRTLMCVCVCVCVCVRRHLYMHYTHVAHKTEKNASVTCVAL